MTYGAVATEDQQHKYQMLTDLYGLLEIGQSIIFCHVRMRFLFMPLSFLYRGFASLLGAVDGGHRQGFGEQVAQ